MAELILSTLAKLLECEPEQIEEALAEMVPEQRVTLEQLLAFHSKLCDIIIHDADLEMYCNYRDYPDGRS